MPISLRELEITGNDENILPDRSTNSYSSSSTDDVQSQLPASGADPGAMAPSQTAAGLACLGTAVRSCDEQPSAAHTSIDSTVQNVHSVPAANTGAATTPTATTSPNGQDAGPAAISPPSVPPAGSAAAAARDSHIHPFPVSAVSTDSPYTPLFAMADGGAVVTQAHVDATHERVLRKVRKLLDTNRVRKARDLVLSHTTYTPEPSSAPVHADASPEPEALAPVLYGRDGPAPVALITPSSTHAQLQTRSTRRTATGRRSATTTSRCWHARRPMPRRVLSSPSAAHSSQTAPSLSCTKARRTPSTRPHDSPMQPTRAPGSRRAVSAPLRWCSQTREASMCSTSSPPAT